MDADDKLALACRRGLRYHLLQRKWMIPNRSKVADQQVVVEFQNEFQQLKYAQALKAERHGLERYDEAQKAFTAKLERKLIKSAENHGIHPWIRGDSSPIITDCNFLYTSDDLLTALKLVIKSSGDPFINGIPMLGLRSMSIEELRNYFDDIHPSLIQIGIESVQDLSYKEHEDLGLHVLRSGDIKLMQTYLRKGVCPGLRPKLYKSILENGMRHLCIARDFSNENQSSRINAVFALRENKEDLGSSKKLKKGIRKAKKMPVEKPEVVEILPFGKSETDLLNELDLISVRNDDTFFVFEDLLQGILPELFHTHIEWLLLNSRTGDLVFPFDGLSMQTAPLAYVFRDAQDIIYCFRQMFSKYWCQLNTLRNSPTGSNLTLLPNLCAQFLNSLSEKTPNVMQKLIALEMDPLDIAFPWIHKSFCGYLPVEQLLHLWDRIIGYDSLMILPVAAAAIFKYREPILLRMESKSDVFSVMNELENVNVIAVIQGFIFVD